MFFPMVCVTQWHIGAHFEECTIPQRSRRILSGPLLLLENVVGRNFLLVHASRPSKVIGPGNPGPADQKSALKCRIRIVFADYRASSHRIPMFWVSVWNRVFAIQPAVASIGEKPPGNLPRICLNGSDVIHLFLRLRDLCSCC